MRETNKAAETKIQVQINNMAVYEMGEQVVYYWANLFFPNGKKYSCANTTKAKYARRDAKREIERLKNNPAFMRVAI